MQPPENEPTQPAVERLVTDEERGILHNPLIPDEVKSEIVERLNRFAEADADETLAEDARNFPVR